MNSMKYFLLSVVCLCFTIGVQAQTAKFIREYRNPKIEGLLNYAESLGREVTVVHTGEYKRMSFFVERYNDFRYKIEGRDMDDDLHGKLNQEYDERERKSVLLMDSIRNTFSALLDDASMSYMWEVHEGGVDSMYFTVALGSYSNSKVKERRREDWERELEYSFAPEILAFKYSQHEPGHVPATYHSTQGSGWFEYKFQPEDADSNRVEVDMRELIKIVGKVLKKNKMKYRTLHTEMDSTYDWRNKDEILYYSRPQGMGSVTTSLIYDTKPKEEAMEILEEIKAALWDYLDKHPDADFMIHNANAFSRLSFDPIRVYKVGREDREQFCVSVQYIERRNEYCFLISTAKGSCVLPTGWGRLKSWKNGVKKYYKEGIINKQHREK